METERIGINTIDTMKDIDAFQFLYDKTGRATVPCLLINGDPMHESEDIIKWLQEEKINGNLKNYIIP